MFLCKQMLSIIALLGCLVLPALASETFSDKADYTALNSCGEVVAFANGSTQTPIDVDDDLRKGERDDLFVKTALQLGAFRLFADYRHLEIDVDNSVVLFDASLSGPYAGALVRF